MAHSAQHNGLQSWSVGDIYPWTIRGVGNSLQAFNCLTGETGPEHSYTPGDSLSFGDAHDLAEACIPADDEADDDEGDFGDDGQPDEYTEWQDYFGGDDWDHGQYDE